MADIGVNGPRGDNPALQRVVQPGTPQAGAPAPQQPPGDPAGQPPQDAVVVNLSSASQLRQNEEPPPPPPPSEEPIEPEPGQPAELSSPDSATLPVESFAVSTDPSRVTTEPPERPADVAARGGQAPEEDGPQPRAVDLFV